MREFQDEEWKKNLYKYQYIKLANIWRIEVQCRGSTSFSKSDVRIESLIYFIALSFTSQKQKKTKKCPLYLFMTNVIYCSIGIVPVNISQRQLKRKFLGEFNAI